MDWTDGLGLVAGVGTTITTIPQISKVLKTKDAKDLSKRTFMLLIIGISLWIVYGIFKKDIPILVTNSVGLLLNITLLVLKFKYGTQKQSTSS